MKYFKILFLLVMALMMVVPSQDAFGDTTARRKKKKKPEAIKEEKQKKDLGLTHCLGLYGGAMYSNFLHKIENSKTPGGGGAMVGVQYMLKKHKPGNMYANKMFTFSVGVEPMFINSSTRLNDFDYFGTMTYQDDVRSLVMDYNMAFSKYKEQQNQFRVNVPLMFGGQISRYYFGVGAKAGIGLISTYSTKADVNMTATDPELVDQIGRVPDHNLDYIQAKGKGKINMGLDVTASAEFGIVMDEWMPAGAMLIGNKKKQIPMSYRLGVFLDYGVMNLYTGKAGDGTDPQSNPLTVLTYTGDPVNGPALAGTTTAAQNFVGIKPNSILNSDRWTPTDSKLNSLCVGAKFTMLFQVYPQPVPVKKKPRPRPKPKQVKIPTYPPFFYCVTLDGETDGIIPGQVTLTRIDTKDTAYTAKLDPSVGFVENQMVSEKFLINVKCRGYMDYNDTVYQIDNDTLYCQLMPIKKNTVVILRNLLFDTDKTIIKNTSVQSLEDLYKLLSENPSLRIQITGHTDNVGSDRYNQKLSEGRAKAVYQEMVKRGINPKRMSWRGAGEAEPIESNDTPEGRAENRRVEFMIL